MADFFAELFMSIKDFFSKNKPDAAASDLVSLKKNPIQRQTADTDENAMVGKITQDAYRLLMVFLFSLVALCILLVAMNITLLFRDPPRPDVYMADTVGGVTKLKVFNKPNLSQSSIMNFASDKVTWIMSFSFANADVHIDDVKTAFTDKGWERFKLAMKYSGFMSNVISNQENIKVTLDGAVIINKSSTIEDGLAYWEVEVPVQIFREAKGKIPAIEKRLIVVSLMHMMDSKYDRGIGIDGFQLKERVTQ